MFKLLIPDTQCAFKSLTYERAKRASVHDINSNTDGECNTNVFLYVVFRMGLAALATFIPLVAGTTVINIFDIINLTYLYKSNTNQAN